METLPPSRDLIQDQDSESGFIPMLLEIDTSDNEGEDSLSENRAIQRYTKPKTKRQATSKTTVPREQILKRYQTVSIPKIKIQPDQDERLKHQKD